MNGINDDIDDADDSEDTDLMDDDTDVLEDDTDNHLDAMERMGWLQLWFLEQSAQIQYAVGVTVFALMLFASHIWLLLAPWSSSGFIDAPLCALRIVVFSLIVTIPIELDMRHVTSLLKCMPLLAAFGYSINDTADSFFAESEEECLHESNWYIRIGLQLLLQAIYVMYILQTQLLPSKAFRICLTVYTISGILGMMKCFLACTSTLYYIVSIATFVYFVLNFIDDKLFVNRIPADFESWQSMKQYCLLVSNAFMNYGLGALTLFGVMHCVVVLCMQVFVNYTLNVHVFVRSLDLSTSIVPLVAMLANLSFMFSILIALSQSLVLAHLKLGLSDLFHIRLVLCDSLFSRSIEAGLLSLPTILFQVDKTGVSLVLLTTSVLTQTFIWYHIQIYVLPIEVGANNTSRLTTLRARLMTFMLLILPVICCFYFSKYVGLNFLTVLFISGCLEHIVVILNGLTEDGMVLISWKFDVLENLDDILYGLKIIGKLLLTLCMAIGIYYRLFTAIFRSSLLARLVIICSSTCLRIYFILYAEWKEFMYRRQCFRQVQTVATATAGQIVEYNDVCAICLGNLYLGVKVTPCGHIFHEACLRKWFLKQPTCPMDNKPIFEK